MWSASQTQLPIILYHYPYSPYARRIVWYLRLRGIPYMECIQPPLLPRPHLSSHLSLSYRRIPVLAVGRDVYLDTRLILRKLESLPPAFAPASSPPLGAADGTEARALERLLSVLTTGTDLFFRAAELLPAELPLMRDPAFRKDREDFFKGRRPDRRVHQRQVDQDAPGGGVVGGEARAGSSSARGEEEEEKEKAAAKAEALRAIKDAMALLETTLLADGREFVLGTKGPTLADIEAVWPFHWLIGLPGALYDPEQVSREKFPRVYAWVERFQATVGAAKRRTQVRAITGEEAAGVIKGEQQHGYYEAEAELDHTEPLVKAYGLEKGTRVEVWPTDSGTAHRDRGRLVGIGSEEIVWETDAGARVHAPRGGFRVRPILEGNDIWENGGEDGVKERASL
ncbi:hypothetical protein VTI74DRAFT_194 [Chaetomium olivicolor]